MQVLNKWQAKTRFFNGEPLILQIPMVRFSLEFTLKEECIKKLQRKKTYYFDKLIAKFVELAIAEYPYSSISERHVQYVTEN